MAWSGTSVFKDLLCPLTSEKEGKSVHTFIKSHMFVILKLLLCRLYIPFCLLFHISSSLSPSLSLAFLLSVKHFVTYVFKSATVYTMKSMLDSWIGQGHSHQRIDFPKVYSYKRNCVEVQNEIVHVWRSTFIQTQSQFLSTNIHFLFQGPLIRGRLCGSTWSCFSHCSAPESVKSSSSEGISALTGRSRPVAPQSRVTVRCIGALVVTNTRVDHHHRSL